MTTVLFSAAGAAVGGSIGGTLAGLSSVAIGRAVGATLGRVVDQRLLGQGSQAVETGKVERFRLTSTGEGEAIAQLYGRMRLGGQVIWASDFQETASVSGGGKGAAPTPTTTAYSYSVSLAIALCEGEITRVGRVWADGEEIAPDDLNIRVYKGSKDQRPDPTIEAVEGRGEVPAYRGLAYVVMENLSLQQFGNRVPQFTFEVIRPEQADAEGGQHALSHGLKGVAMIPGTGEYSLATTAVNYLGANQARWSANVSSPAGKSDFAVSLESLSDELPQLEAGSLIVSWFGNDLRCGSCDVRPMIEKPTEDGENMPWLVAGLTRQTAEAIAQQDGRPVYGGTPTDQSVIEAIQAMNAAGKAVMFYPFILMDQMEDNALPDPYGGEKQAILPWRGRITLDLAPGLDGSADGTARAQSEVDAFFGGALAEHFTVQDGEVTYSGPDEWRFNRFILHYAALAKAAGGVDTFCIGSEMRGLTQIRGAGNSFPAVERLVELAAQVRAILGPDTKISYAADWTEYFGYHPQDGSGDVYFHLDALWADENIDFVGIDNYMPIADWRDGVNHLDAREWASIYDLDYLQSNIEGGEGHEWYYDSEEARDAQHRRVIEDGSFDEPWVFRYKDMRGWWSNFHHNRISGVRDGFPTAWVPGSKPIVFTEYGCAAIDKGANQPNKFLDPKSSESALPRYSSGARDDLMQMQYLRATVDYWNQPENNPEGIEYDGRMIDMSRAFAWAWDVRPYPQFPTMQQQWSDGISYARGHWLNGRTSSQHLASVVREICERAGVSQIDVSGLHGGVRGFAVEQVRDARSALQPLMLQYGFDAIERGGVLVFRMRDGLREIELDTDTLALSDELSATTVETRDSDADMSGRVRLRFVQADANFDVIAEEAVLPDEASHAVASTELNMVLTRSEGRQRVERWLTEARMAREHVKFALPPSRLDIGAGDVVSLSDEATGTALYRVDRVEQGASQLIEAVRIDPEVYEPSEMAEDAVALQPFVPPAPVTAQFLDLPLLKGDEVPHAPYVAASAQPWPGNVALYSGQSDANYRLNTLLPLRATLGETLNDLPMAGAGRFDDGVDLQVQLFSGTLESMGSEALFAGANMAAIGDGSSGNWEVFQFEQAELLAPDVYHLKRRLRGQVGSDGVMPPFWPAGSQFVLLNGAMAQIDLPRNLRRVAQHYRIGPACKAVSDPVYQQIEQAFDGNGLRPYAPCHLSAHPLANGDFALRWIRRTRIDGDDWETLEVPLGEESETYLCRVLVNGETVREVTTSAPTLTYDAASQTADGAVGGFELEVAQVSAVYGPGPFSRMNVSV